ncbi:MAG: hypothetical protein PVJ63_08390 [Thioalkalispiraceae bacterium]|jgi:hypothetical protein
MDDSAYQHDLYNWLKEARELMIASELCWKSEELFRKQYAQGKVLMINNRLLKLYLDSEVELNWLYNILAGLTVYYLALGVIFSRRQAETIGDYPEQHIIELLEKCGIKLDRTQQVFLRRVEDAMAMIEQDKGVNVHLTPEQLKLMKQIYAEQNTVTLKDKQAIDTLNAKLLAMMLKELSSSMADNVTGNKN